MKKMLALLFLFMFVLSGSALSETFTWTNPTAYVDGSTIPSAKQAQIKTHIFWGTIAGGPWTEFTAVSNGAMIYVGAPPPERGVAAYYTMAWELDGVQSAYLAPAVSYTRPFIACTTGSNLVIK